MWCRGIRGATPVVANTKEDILTATQELLQKMTDVNQVEKETVACIFFTTTSDLNAEFPALAARQLGWTETPLLCGQEMNVPGSFPKCLRILILFNTEKKPEEIEHIYIKGAEVLRQGLES
ncbi:chorismate mutase [Chloroflexota bacterium]